MTPNLRQVVLRFAAIAVCSLPPQIAFADADCLNYADFMQLVSSTRMPGRVNGIEISGRFVYVAAGESGLVVLELSEAAGAGILSQLPAGYALDVSIDHSTACIASSSGLHMVDVGDPWNPREVGSLSLPAAGRRKAAVFGGFAFLAGHGLEIVDIRDPQRPILAGHIDINGATDVAISGTTVFVAGTDLTVIDVSDPRTPRVIESAAVPSALESVSITGNHAYASARQNEYSLFPDILFVLDIAQPHAPRVVGQLSVLAVSSAVAEDGIAWIASGYGVIAADVARPSVPREIGRYHLPGGEGDPIAVAGGRVITGRNDRLSVFSIGLLRPRPPLASIPMPECRWTVAARGRLALVASSRGTVQALDVSEPDTPRVLDTLSTSDDWTGAISESIDLACIASGRRVDIVDIRDPSDLRRVGSWTAKRPLRQIAITGRLVLVSDRFDRLLTLDCADPTQPRILGSLQIRSPIRAIRAAGDRACVATTAGVDWVDLQNPAEPRIVGSAQVGDVRDLALSDTRAYIAAGEQILVFDLEGPESPRRIGELRFPTRPTSLSLSGSMLAASTSPGTIHFIDVAIPEEPTEFGRTGDSVQHIAFASSCLLSVDGDGRDGFAGCRVYALPCLPPIQPTDSRPPAPLLLWPNPTRGRLQIRLEVPAGGFVSARVYDVGGRHVRTLSEGRLLPGSHEFQWDGLDATGRRAAAGVYLIHAATPAGRAGARCVLLR